MSRHKEWDLMESQGRTREHYQRNASGCIYIIIFMLILMLGMITYEILKT